MRRATSRPAPRRCGKWVSGSATLYGAVNRADSRGIVSTGVRLGQTPGQVRIRVSLPGDSTVTPLIFTANVDAAVGALRKISGDNQAATINTNFADPLVIEVLDQQSRPVSGVTLGLASSGDVQVPSSVITGSDGRAAAAIRAGNTPGTYTIRATIGNASETFTVTVRPLAPVITSITNNASGRADDSVAPCSVVNINGSTIVPTLSGTRIGNTLGRQPLTLEGVSVRFNGISAPIFSVTGGGSRGDIVSVQVPCELTPGSANVEILAGAQAPGNATVRVTPVAPGIYEETDASGNRRAVVLRSNGQQASATNPAEAGETVRILATGLGLVSPNTGTNEPGIGAQRVINDIVVGLNNEGIFVNSAGTEYASGFLGVYYITFQIPSNVIRGTNRPLVIAASGADGNVVYSAASAIDIR